MEKLSGLLICAGIKKFRFGMFIGIDVYKRQVMDAAGIGREQGADFVIGVGGGSPLDAAKAIAMMIHNRDTSSEVLYQKITLRALPVVAVPTTCGTCLLYTSGSQLSKIRPV